MLMGVAAPAHLRIGELSRRTGVRPEVIRAWERRYKLLAPERSAGGFRLYSDDDVERLRQMRRHLDDGLSAAQAAARAVADESSLAATPTELEVLRGRLAAALDTFSESRSHEALDALLGSFGLETVLRDALLPYLHELGERWQRGEASVAQEHFASNLLRGRLLGIAAGLDRGEGRHALLACAPGEQHDLPLILFGLALRRRGWRVTSLGPDTPVETLADAARALEPDLVVVVAVRPEPLECMLDELRALAADVSLALGGPGATVELAAAIPARRLTGDPVRAAAELRL